MIPEVTTNNIVKKARTCRENENVRRFGSCLNNNHLETVRETISENSGSIIGSSIDVKDVKKENENDVLDKRKILIENKYSECDKNIKNIFENDKSTYTEHNNNMNNMELNEKFKYYDLFLHNNTKKTSIKTDSL